MVLKLHIKLFVIHFNVFLFIEMDERINKV